MTPAPESVSANDFRVNAQIAHHCSYLRCGHGVIALRMVLMLVAVIGSLRAAVTPAPMTAFTESSKTIAEHIFADDTHALAGAVLTDLWYHPQQKDGIAEKIRGLVEENRAAIEGSYGRITNRAVLVGSLHVGRQTEMVYYVTGEFADLPIKIVYINRDDGLFISGFFFGNTVQDSILKLSDPSPAAVWEQLEQ